ncbi:unnamed protein product, partial [Mesorhabditis spiculigera]
MSEEPTKTQDNVNEAPENKEDPKTEDGGLNDWLNAGTSWGSSWLQNAKQKTFQTFELVKKDLNEIKDVIGNEVTGITTAAKGGIESVGAQLKQQAQLLENLVTPDEEERPTDEANPPGQTKKSEVPNSNSMGFGWMKNLVDTVKNFGVEDTTLGENDHTEVIRRKGMRRTTLPLNLLKALQSDESTYLVPPEEPATFQAWLKKFNMGEHDGEIEMLMSSMPELKTIYERLVPDKVDAETFWMRYFYKVEIAEIDEEMKHTLKDLKINTEQKQKLKEELQVETERSEPTSGAQSNDGWSFCENQDIEELTSNGEDTEKEDDRLSPGPLTPKLPEDPKVEPEASSPAKKQTRSKKGKNSSKQNSGWEQVPRQ